MLRKEVSTSCVEGESSSSVRAEGKVIGTDGEALTLQRRPDSLEDLLEKARVDFEKVRLKIIEIQDQPKPPEWNILYEQDRALSLLALGNQAIALTRTIGFYRRAIMLKTMGQMQ